MEKGKIIFLNGVSSAGKTTLARTLQDRLSEPFYILANDTFTDDKLMCPDKFVNSNADETYGKILSAMHHTIRTFADIGINTIVDDVLLKEDGILYNVTKQDNLDECVELLHEYDVLFVHVTCPIEELRRREKERGDRDIGQGESQLTRLNPQDSYDITVDTFCHSKEECADKIIEFLNVPDKNKSFKKLWSQRKG